MGNSSLTIDKHYVLAPHTLILLRPFGVFNEFPKDKIEADHIISNIATNALKLVSSRFSNRLGNHNKHKQESYDDIITSSGNSLLSTPTQQLRRQSPRY